MQSYDSVFNAVNLLPAKNSQRSVDLRRPVAALMNCPGLIRTPTSPDRPGGRVCALLARDRSHTGCHGDAKKDLCRQSLPRTNGRRRETQQGEYVMIATAHPEMGDCPTSWTRMTRERDSHRPPSWARSLPSASESWTGALINRVIDGLFAGTDAGDKWIAIASAPRLLRTWLVCRRASS